MPSQTQVRVHFDTKGSNPFVIHKGQHVPLNGQGKGSFTTDVGEFDLILFGMRGTPGTAATITLSVSSPRVLRINGHPIKGKIAHGKAVWGDSRFFKVV